jgi:hypothetical protein
MAGRLTHFYVSDDGLIIQNTSTDNNKPGIVTLASGETNIEVNDIIGSLKFQAPDEDTGTASILVCGSIDAVSEGDFATDNNATKLSFKTGDSAVASEKMVLSSTGTLKLKETSAAVSDSADFGQLWVKNTNPTELYFTNDDGNDIQITSGTSFEGGGASSLNELNDVVFNISNFSYSLIIGHETTGTLDADDAASSNIAIGIDAMSNITTAKEGVFIGYQSGQYVTTGYRNTGIGYQCLKGLDGKPPGNLSTAAGSNCVPSLGESGVFSYLSSWVTCLGAYCGFSKTTRGSLTAAGYESGYSETTATNNSYLGAQSGYTNITGNDNTFIGYKSGYNATYRYNTFIGYESGLNVTTGTNNLIIGYQANATVPAATNEITLGDGNITTLRCADTTIATLSDERDKTNIINCPYGIEYLDKLRPVQYTWKKRVLTKNDENNIHNGKKRIGFIAQEIQDTMSNNENEILDLVYESNPERLEFKQDNLLPIIVKAIQDIQEENNKLKKIHDELSNLLDKY